MEQWQIMMSAVLAVFAVVGIGAAGRRVRWLSAEADQSLLKLVVNILVPSLILSRTLRSDALSNPWNVAIPPLVGFVTVVGGFLLARFAARLLARPAQLGEDRQKRTFALCVGLYNYGFVPIPLAEALFPNDGTVAVLFVHNLGVEIALWTVGVLMISGHVGGGWYRRLINAPSIAIVASLLLRAAGLNDDVPPFLMRAFEMLGVSAIPLSLVLIGATIADVVGGAKITQGGPVIVFSALLRLGLLPALFLLLAWVIPASPQLKQVIVLEAAMPSAIFPIVLSRHYGGDSPTAVRVVLGTSILSLATMPIWLFAGLRMLGQ